MSLVLATSKEIGKEMKRIRKSRGINLADVPARGFNAHTAAAIEHGKKISLTILERYAKLFNAELVIGIILPDEDMKRYLLIKEQEE